MSNFHVISPYHIFESLNIKQVNAGTTKVFFFFLSMFVIVFTENRSAKQSDYLFILLAVPTFNFVIPLASRNCFRKRMTGLAQPKFQRISCSAFGKCNAHSGPNFDFEIGTKNPSFLRPSAICFRWFSSRPFNHADSEIFFHIPGSAVKKLC